MRKSFYSKCFVWLVVLCMVPALVCPGVRGYGALPVMKDAGPDGILRSVGAALKGAVVFDGESLCLFLTKLAVHPVQTSTEMFQALGTLSKMACAGEWELLSETLAPEAYELITRWEVLPAAERSRQAGYLFGKYGADIVAPGIAAKALSRGAKSAKELLAVQRTLKNSEKLLLLESSAVFEATKVAEIVQVAETTITLAEEVGLTTPEIVKLKEAGTLTEATRPLSDFLINNPHLIESWQFFKKAEAALEQYREGCYNIFCRCSHSFRRVFLPP